MADKERIQELLVETVALIGERDAARGIATELEAENARLRMLVGEQVARITPQIPLVAAAVEAMNKRIKELLEAERELTRLRAAAGGGLGVPETKKEQQQ